MIRHEWTSPTGDTINLSGSDVFISDGGVEGLDFPSTKSFVQETPALSGQFFRGFKEEPRDVFWPVVISGDDWFATQRRFWSALRPGKYGTWRVTAPDGTYRDLQCRFAPEPGTYATDPSAKGVERAGVRLVADDPWWKGETVARSFQQAGASSPFYSSTGASSVLTLSSGFTLDVATVTNPGDVGAWPTWTIVGPVTGFTIGYGFSLISASITLTAGEYLVIDTDPRNQVVRKYPSDTLVPFSQFSAIEFAEIPPGESVRLSLSITGTGSVDVSFAPRFYRAF